MVVLLGGVNGRDYTDGRRSFTTAELVAGLRGAAQASARAGLRESAELLALASIAIETLSKELAQEKARTAELEARALFLLSEARRFRKLAF